METLTRLNQTLPLGAKDGPDTVDYQNALAYDPSIGKDVNELVLLAAEQLNGLVCLVLERSNPILIRKLYGRSRVRTDWVRLIMQYARKDGMHRRRRHEYADRLVDSLLEAQPTLPAPSNRDQ